MGDPVTPVTMAVIGGTIGAATNSKNPIEGALMGAVGGYAGGSMMSAGGGSTSPFSLGSILNGIGTNTAAGGDPTKGLAMNAAALAGSGGGFGGGNYGSIGTAGQTAGSAGSAGGLFGGSGSAAGNIFGQGGTLSQVNQGLSTLNQANQLFGGDQQPMQMAPAGQISRGQPQPMDYMSLLNPQQQTVMRPQPFSLI
jgi:hypothetical protein